ncbi:hypothetical protein RBB50_000601 [Rhinocladiella similis]
MTEVNQMAEIYKHSTLTVSASKADDASKGFLLDEANPDTGLWKNLIPLGFPLPEPAASSIDDVFKMPRKVFGTIWLCDEDRVPLTDVVGASRKNYYPADSYHMGDRQPGNALSAYKAMTDSIHIRKVRSTSAGSPHCSSNMDRTFQRIHSISYKLVNEYTQRDNTSLASREYG